MAYTVGCSSRFSTCATSISAACTIHTLWDSFMDVAPLSDMHDTYMTSIVRCSSMFSTIAHQCDIDSYIDSYIALIHILIHISHHYMPLKHWWTTRCIHIALHIARGAIYDSHSPPLFQWHVCFANVRLIHNMALIHIHNMTLIHILIHISHHSLTHMT